MQEGAAPRPGARLQHRSQASYGPTPPSCLRCWRRLRPFCGTRTGRREWRQGTAWASSPCTLSTTQVGGRGQHGLADHLRACTVDSDWLLLLLLLLLPPPAVSIRHPGHPLPLPLRPAAASLCADAGIAAPPASQPGAEANPSAAAAAAAAACAAVKREEPEPSAEGSAGAAAAAAAAAAEQALRLASFDVRRVLEQGTPLLASGGEVGRGGGWGPWGSGCLPGAAAAADAGWASLLLLLSALLWTCVLLRVRCPAAAAAANLHPLPWHATALPVLLLPPPPPRSTTWRWRRGSAGTRPWPRSGPR